MTKYIKHFYFPAFPSTQPFFLCCFWCKIVAKIYGEYKNSTNWIIRIKIDLIITRTIFMLIEIFFFFLIHGTEYMIHFIFKVDTLSPWYNCFLVVLWSIIIIRQISKIFIFIWISFRVMYLFVNLPYSVITFYLDSVHLIHWRIQCDTNN